MAQTIVKVDDLIRVFVERRAEAVERLNEAGLPVEYIRGWLAAYDAFLVALRSM